MELMLKTLTVDEKEKMVDAFAKLDSISDAISIAERMIMTFTEVDILSLIGKLNKGDVDLRHLYGCVLPRVWVVGHESNGGQALNKWIYKISEYYPGVKFMVMLNEGEDRAESIPGLTTVLKNNEKLIVGLKNITPEEIRKIHEYEFVRNGQVIVVGGIQTKRQQYNLTECGDVDEVKVNIRPDLFGVIEIADVMLNEYEIPAMDTSTYNINKITKTIIPKHRFKHNNRNLLSVILFNMRSHVEDFYNESEFDNMKLYEGLVFYICDSCRIMIP